MSGDLLEEADDVVGRDRQREGLPGAGTPMSGSASVMHGQQGPHAVISLERQQAAGGEEAQVARRVRGPDDRDDVLGLAAVGGVGARPTAEEPRASALSQPRAAARGRSRTTWPALPSGSMRVAVDGDAHAARVAEREPEPFARLELVFSNRAGSSPEKTGAPSAEISVQESCSNSRSIETPRSVADGVGSGGGLRLMDRAERGRARPRRS